MSLTLGQLFDAAGDDQSSPDGSSSDQLAHEEAVAAFLAVEERRKMAGQQIKQSE